MLRLRQTWIGAGAISALALLLGCSDAPGAPATLSEAGDSASVLDVEGAQIPFSKLKLFLEFNSTDDDLGVQLLLDADDWQWVKGQDPRGREVVDIDARGRLRQLGITELFFESAEPSPAEVLALIPAGIYSFSGKTVDGERLAGTATLSHSLPAAPVFSPSHGELVDAGNVLITWTAISGLASFQVIVVDETLGREIVADVAPSVTSFQVPATFLRPNAQYKAEVLAVATNGNKTITEGTFQTKP